MVDEKARLYEEEKGMTNPQLVCREDGRVERICEHGIGHTIYAPISQGKAGFIHGCDGCCKEWTMNCKRCGHTEKQHLHDVRDVGMFLELCWVTDCTCKQFIDENGKEKSEVN